MAQTKEEIIVDIDAHMIKRGGKNSDWYVGIAADAEKRLFNDHNVDKDNDHWIYAQASSSDIAREIEKEYLDSGHSGGPGGGDDDTDMVYAYKMTPTTKE